MRDGGVRRWWRATRRLGAWPVALLLTGALVTQVAFGALALRLGPFAATARGLPTPAAPVARDAARGKGAAVAARATPSATATVTSTATPSPSPVPATTNGCPITPEQTGAEQHVLDLLNQHRAAAGVAALTLDPALAAVARAHSCDMFQHQLMSHTGSDGLSPFQRIQAAGIHYTSAGENIGTSSGYGLIPGVEMNDRDMMAEPLTPYDHHWNIVNAGYAHTGIGVVYANGQEWLTEDFVG